MNVFTNAGVGVDDRMRLHRTPDDGSVQITLGDEDIAERITLEFDDPAALDRLAALAVEGAQRLRALVADAESDDESDEVDDDRPVERAG